MCLFALAAKGVSPSEDFNKLICCGWDEAFILDLNQDPPKKIWSWRAKDCAELPEYMKDKFKYTDECKPVDGGKKILITGSVTGGAVLVERATNRLLFYAALPNAHSADLLPRNRVVVAASDIEGGNRLVLYDVAASDKPLWYCDLFFGHGVVWDEKRKLVWALGSEWVKGYRLKDWETDKPSLSEALSIKLPSGGGHDLYPLCGLPGKMIVTTHEHVWIFDCDEKTFTPHPVLDALCEIKGVSRDPVTGRLAYVQAEKPDFWSRRIHLLDPKGELYFPDEHFYKVRWLIYTGVN